MSKYIWTFNKLCLNLNWIFSYLVIYLLSCTGCITFAVVIISSFVCCTTQRVWVLAILYLCPSYPSQCGCPFIFSCRKIFSASLLVFLINSCSTNSCNFGVSVRGGKVRVFLFAILAILFLTPFMLRKFQGLRHLCQGCCWAFSRTSYFSWL